MKIDTETEKKIQDLQLLEQNLQHFLIEKQSIQIELNEVSNALEELQKTKDEVYRILSNIMIKSDKESLFKELQDKKKILELRISLIEKQERLVEEKAIILRKELNLLISREKN